MAIGHGTAKEIRQAIRSGKHTGQTSGMARGHVQGNMAILPKAWADEFLEFCHFNPKPCPVIGMTQPGQSLVPELGKGIDLRSDLPQYHVWQDGQLVDKVADITDLWRDDLVGFVIGCSHSFEDALLNAGVPIRNIELGRSVAMYETNIACRPAGRFHGPMVVSMRSMTPSNAIRAVQVCTRFPQVHGAPIHLGDPSAIGISDLNKTAFGGSDAEITVPKGEIPVFWACGVTPQAVLRKSKPPFCITHAPGCMLITDLLNSELALF